MSQFVLADEVEDLKFNFEPYPLSTQKDVDEFADLRVGVIPEPTSAQIQNFRTSIAEMLTEMLPDESPSLVEDDPIKLRKLLLATIGKDQTVTQQKALHAIADVCSGKPSFDVLNALPWRHQQAFSGWISGIFLLPQAPTPATNG